MEKPLQIKGFQKETGHPLQYLWYQNWCPVMAEMEGFDEIMVLPPSSPAASRCPLDICF